MINIRPLSLVLIAALAACSPANETSNPAYKNAATDHQHQTSTPNPADITLGNGVSNQIELEGITRNGPTLIVPRIMAAQDSFLVLHPFKDDVPVQTDYSGATFVSAGVNTNVALRLDGTPVDGSRFIIMLHADVNRDGTLQFGDGVTVPDAPVFEGTTLIALPMLVPATSPVTPDLIRASAKEHRDKAANFTERAAYRDDPIKSRARALIHRYVAVVEGDGQTVEAIQGLFTPEFLINFSSGPIDTLDGFNAWLEGPAASVSAARHVLHDVTVTPLDGSRHQVDMMMTWDGLTPSGGRMTAKTHHEWIVQESDDTLRIERIDVEVLEPFILEDWDVPSKP
jgi:hypothetical protein